MRWSFPKKDSVTSFALNGAKFVPSVMAMDPISFATSSYPAPPLVLDTAVAITLLACVGGWSRSSHVLRVKTQLVRSASTLCRPSRSAAYARRTLEAGLRRKEKAPGHEAGHGSMTWTLDSVCE
jgi:hypothetical protein